MINYETFDEIHKNKKLGRTVSQTARFLKLARQTVKKYWNMSHYDFIKKVNKETMRKKKSKCYQYRTEIAEMIHDINEIPASTIYDRLIEEHGDIECCERTVRREVKRIRNDLNIPRSVRERDYQAAEETEPGQQAQVDFGEYHLRQSFDKNKRKKIYFFMMVLRHSRYKYVECSDRKYTAEMAVKAHQRAFEYFGGIPREIVYDQDSVFIVSENEGEIIETAQFRSYLASMPFTHYVAKRSDPETKGCIEKYVQFFKNNFLYGRLFKDIGTLNEQALKWLDRTGNYKICRTINERPVDRMKNERQALLSVDKVRNDLEFLEIIPHKVGKDNTVSYKGNRYRVPYNTYNSQRNHEVGVTEVNGHLHILDLLSHNEIISHPVCKEKGKLIGKKDEKPMSFKTASKIIEVLECFNSYNVNASEFINKVCSAFNRYIPDQMDVIIRAFNDNRDCLTEKIVSSSLKICMEQENYSAHAFGTILKNHCDLERMDSSMKDQMSEERSKDLPEGFKMGFCNTETDVKDIDSQAKLESMWGIFDETKE